MRARGPVRRSGVLGSLSHAIIQGMCVQIVKHDGCEREADCRVCSVSFWWVRLPWMQKSHTQVEARRRDAPRCAAREKDAR